MFPAVTLPEIVLVKRLDLDQMLLQRPHQHVRQHGSPVLTALSFPHENLAPREVDVLHAKAQNLEYAHPGAVHRR
jgi:hypothetical protein